MMPGILIGGSDASGKKVDIAYIGYGSLVSRRGTSADVQLPTPLQPQTYSDGMFGYDFARVNPESLGIGIDAIAIEKEWEGLKRAGLPLEEVTRGLIVRDITEMIRGIPAQTPGHVHHQYPSIPSFALVVELVGHVGEIRAFHSANCDGFDRRLGQLRRNLKGVFRGKAFGEVPWPEYCRVIAEASILIASKQSEFNVLKQLLRLGHICRLSQTGADIVVADKNDLRAEIKSRHEDMLQYLISEGQTQGIIGPDPVSLLPESLFALLSWSTFASIRRAMDEQKSQILFCDLSHTFAGVLLSAVENFWNIHLSFPDGVREGFNLAADGKQVAVIFVSFPGVTHHLRAAVFERSAIEPIGKALWNMNKQLALSSPQLAKFLADVFKKEDGGGVRQEGG